MKSSRQKVARASTPVPVPCILRHKVASVAVLFATTALGSSLLVGEARAQTQNLPTGGSVAAGSVSMANTSATRLNITQSSQSAVVNWQGFSVGQGYSVNIQQPNSSSALLNRVTGDAPSTIAGSLTANGQVYLVNPNGIAITKSGVVNTGGGFVASTLGISDADFMSGKRVFTGNGASAPVSNAGVISVGRGGYAALIGGTVENTGRISVPLGKVGLGSGERVTLDFAGDGFMQVALPTAASGTGALIQNSGKIKANGGSVIISAATAREAARNAVNISGHVQARTIGGRSGSIIIGGGYGAVNITGRLSANARQKPGRIQGKGGAIAISGDSVQITGALNASGASGGNLRIDARSVAVQSKVDLSGQAGAGGSYTINATGSYIETTQGAVNASGTTAGGGIAVQAANIFSSGRQDVTASAGIGGSIALTANAINLVTASLDASGAAGGGSVRIGGDFQGGGTLAHATSVLVSPGATIKADATASGNGGSIVVWSDQRTMFYGAASARGGANVGNGGMIEVSSKDQLVMGGAGDAAAPKGTAGTLLLDPKNIVIDDTLGLYPQYQLIDPNPNSGNQFGGSVTPLSTGNVVVTSPQDDFGALNAGATYLFNRTTGALISTLTGSTASDQVGLTGVTALTNGNYVVKSTAWQNGGNAQAGAATFGSGTTGVSGGVSAANSLIGTKANDLVGSLGILALSSGNYVVQSPGWDNGSVVNAGAVTFGNGTTGVSGAISAANSLVGTSSTDQVGSVAAIVLTNGNYVVRSPNWDNGAIVNAGAATLGSGITGVSGAVSAANSLVGTTGNDQVGSLVTALSNGNYVVVSTSWHNGAAATGAATFGSGTTGVVGAVSASNSLVGSTQGDAVGNQGVTALTNGNYVVITRNWKNGAVTQAGAVTFGNGTTGVVGVISAANSLVGSTANDSVGSGGVTALSNGNYVVVSQNWNNGTATSAGAVTFGNGTTGVVGAVSAANSLVGTTASDQVGGNGVFALTGNGNYVVRSINWHNGAVANAGAVTFGSGTTGVVGAVSAANSLVGTQTSDLIGSTAITKLSNGNYVVSSPSWHNGSITNAGAVTFGSGTTGVVGAVSAANSLVGTTAGDAVGSFGVTALTNGNYVVPSPNWSNGAVANAGAVTFGSGTTGVVGAVSAANSLVGSTANDQVGTDGVTALTNGNYVVVSSVWNNGGATATGAVTFGSGTTGVVGAVSASNSLVGTTANDSVGGSGVTTLTNGNYVVLSANWNNGAATQAGAATFGSGTTGVSGAVSATNSLVGTMANESVGFYGVTPLTNGNYVVLDTQWSNGAVANAGAVTFGSGTTGVVGAVSAANSLVGSTTNARLGIVAETGATTTFLAKSNTDGGGGRVFVGVTDLNALSFGLAQSQTVTIKSNAVTSVLNAGTNLVLQASNDITVNSAVTANNPGGNGGNLTLQAGRSVLLNANITTDNGNLTLIANDKAVNGVVNAQRDAGATVIIMASGATINAGSGSVSINLRDGAGNTNSTSGAITLGSITAGSISAVNEGLSAGSDIILSSGAVLTASGAGNALVLAAANAFTNNAGAGALSLTGGGRWLVYSRDPSTDTFGSLDSANTAVFNSTYATLAPASVTQTGNRYIFGALATLTVTSTDASKTYGDDATAALATHYSIGGVSGVAGVFLDSAAPIVSGAPAVTSAGAAASATVAGGPYTIDVGQGSLAAPAGYAFAFANPGRLTVNPASATLLTITAADQMKTYGTIANLGTTAFTSAGLVNGDMISGVTLTSAGTVASANVGSYAITASNALGTGLSNYSITYAAGGMLTVNPAALTVTATNQSKTYGATAALGTSGFTSSGLVNSDSISGVTLASIGGAATATVAGGPYVITASNAQGTGLSNYSVTYAAGGMLTVTPAALTITAANQNKTYGATAALGTTAFTSTGLLNSDSISGVTLASAGSVATATVAGGPYAITASNAQGAGLSNYSITYAAGGMLTVNPAALTITATNQNKTYGATAALGTTAFTSIGLLNSDSISGVTLASIGSVATATVAGGPYAITASNAVGTGLSNYTISYASGGQLTVNPAGLTLLTVTASDQSKTYGTIANLGTTAFTSAGLVNGDTISGVTLTSLGTVASANVGSYAITASNALGTGLSNYSITYAAGGMLTVNPAALTVTATNQSKTYGATAALGTSGFTSSGLVNSDSISGVTLASIGSAATATVAGGPYAITASNAQGTGLSNYTVSYTSGGQLSVAPANISVTALGGTSVAGSSPANPGLSATGLVNGDTVASLAGLSNSFGITSASPATNYTLTVAGTLSNTNYNVATRNNGSWVITAADIAVPTPPPSNDPNQFASTVNSVTGTTSPTPASKDPNAGLGTGNELPPNFGTGTFETPGANNSGAALFFADKRFGP